MRKKDIIQIKDENDVDTNKVVMYNSTSDVVGVYKKTELEGFKGRFIEFIERVMEVIEDFSYDIDEKIDELVGMKLFDLYDKISELVEKKNCRKNKNIGNKSVLDKLKPMGEIVDVEEEDMSMKMREFRLEDYREEFRSVYRKSRNKRGSLSVFLAISICFLVLIIFLLIKFVNI